MRRLFFCVLLAAAAGSSPGLNGTLAAQADLMTRDPSGLSGLTSLIHVPTAGILPVGVADLTFDNAITRRFGQNVFYQRNGFLSIGLLPRLTVMARGVVARDSVRLGIPSIRGGRYEKRDLSIGAQFLLFEEVSWAPSVAIGMVDPKTGSAAVNFTGYFLVASKSLFGRSRLTAGYGWGPKAEADGVFGGLEVRLGAWATGMGEYDGDSWNGGLRLTPLAGVADRIGFHPRIDIVQRQGEGTSYAIGARIALGGSPERLRRRPAITRAENPVRASTNPSDPTWAATVTTAELGEIGFEDVLVSFEGSPGEETLAVEYENRRFRGNEWDALGIVMGVASRNAHGSVRHVRVTIRRVNVPVLTVTTELEAFRAFIDGTLSERDFAAQLHFGASPNARSGNEGVRAHSSAFKVDVFLRPGLQSTLLTEFGVADARLWFLPDMYLRLGRGFVLNGRVAVDAGQTGGFLTPLFEDLTGRLLLHKVLPLRIGSASVSGLTQFSGGMFSEGAYGIANQVDMSLSGGRVSLGSTLAAFGPSLREIDSGVALGNIRVRYPEWDLTARLDAGLFRRGDGGAAVELSRFFGESEIGFFSKFTNFGSAAGIRVSVPLSPKRELRPSRLRPRLPDVFSHSKQITILDPSGVSRPWVALPLGTEHEIERIHRGRDRMYPANLRANTGILRRAVLRWLGD